MSAWFGVVTLFPECFAALNAGISGRAQQQGLMQMEYVNPRDHATNKHRTIDDRPYGGGPGMVMEVEPLVRSIDALKAKKPQAPVIYLSPQGQRLQQNTLNRWATTPELILVCGRYEGIDQRVIALRIDECWSIGDYVLSGGELAAMVVIDGITRLLPGALGDETSIEVESFMQGLLDHPHYTRPPSYEGLEVPSVLLQGHHAHIERWRLQQALGNTWQHRPDLLEQLSLTHEQKKLLDEFILKYNDCH